MNTSNNELARVRVNVFPGGFNWGLYVGIDTGLFAREGLRIEMQHTPNSVAQMTDMASGKFDIAMTGVDNIVAYVEGQGEAPIGPQPDFFAFMGSDSAFLSLVCVADIKAIAALQGKQLLVDAMTTGYAFVLYDILRRAGLPAETYEVARAGGMIERWTRLRAGEGDGTLLSAPYNLIAKAHGLTNWRARLKPSAPIREM
ncbi:MAG: ABC transporter substrate-binding protein [Bradyrhizobium sp.]